MKTILILGLGKIGRLKAKIYGELGFLVDGFDIREIEDSEKIFHKTFVRKLPTDISKYTLIDICTPTDLHIIALKNILNVSSKAKILIEKPIASSFESLNELRDLLQQYPKAQIIYSENYFFSSSLAKTKKVIDDDKEEIAEIVIELSKNRIHDNLIGRFADKALKGFGVEIPHALALLDSFGCSQIKNLDVNVRRSNNFSDNFDSIRISAQSDKGIDISIFQSLTGECIYQKPFFVLPDDGVPNHSYRICHMKLKSGNEIAIQFEPIANNSRYTSILSVVKNGEIFHREIFEDNTLRELLKNVTLESSVTKKISIEKAIDLNLKILDLRNLAISKIAT